MIRSTLKYAAMVTLFGLPVAGCNLLTSPEALIYVPDYQASEGKSDQRKRPHKIAVFFDGTSNDDHSETNIWNMFTRVRDTGQVTTFYIEGVGAKGKPIGMAVAWGIDMRVRAAYAFLLQHYRDGDEIYLFGFSRGAYSARILASMLYHAGLPTAPVAANAQVSSEEMSELIYNTFKCSTWSSYKTCAAISSVQRANDIRASLHKKKLTPMLPVEVRFMGLWDTVEALGWPDYEENVDVPNPRYGDQLCNVQRVAHALALDDNRARIFTPILLTRRHLLADCGIGPKIDPQGNLWRGLINAKVEEVYFAGAHADIGGGYEDASGKLSGVSLNWMLDRASKEGLPVGISSSGTPLRVKQQHMSCTHDSESEWPLNFIYKRQYRDIDNYADSSESSSPMVRFHACLIEHIEARPRGSAEYAGSDPLAQDVVNAAAPRTRFNACFSQDKGKLTWAPGDNCLIEVVDSCSAADEPLVPCGLPEKSIQ
ncbi:hypothetical protein PS914_05927 [Pseudomonas fluorescens]|uniref:phospholipase effector Tle1 domain-containing protein n=1 Tax=Pseudomonas fluorescens TaxID=294 RepID=UPI00123EF774|nr:DUF2235 domain-containing protein [Pseudomonas fluorescens]VVQ16903.1 hypothetical protein PS914_05927 [Pseudomonas fluorescens]